MHFSIENWLPCFKNLDFLNQFCKAFLFHSQYTINDCVCMIHEGSKIPGRESKCSLLLREFSRNGQAQYKVTQGQVRLPPMFGNKKISRSRNGTLNTREYRSMQENLEHDRMVCANYDRQSIVFLSEIDERDGYLFHI